jgi:hypothetical protein
MVYDDLVRQGKAALRGPSRLSTPTGGSPCTSLSANSSITLRSYSPGDPRTTGIPYGKSAGWWMMFTASSRAGCSTGCPHRVVKVPDQCVQLAP